MGDAVSKVVLRKCSRLHAKISEKQCAANRHREVLACHECPGLGERVAASEPALADEVILRFTGEEAVLLRRFEKLAENGCGLDANVATLIWMTLEGQLVLRADGVVP